MFAVTDRVPRQIGRTCKAAWRELVGNERALRAKVDRLEAFRCRIEVEASNHESELQREALDIIRLVQPLIGESKTEIVSTAENSSQTDVQRDTEEEDVVLHEDGEEEINLSDDDGQSSGSGHLSAEHNENLSLIRAIKAEERHKQEERARAHLAAVGESGARSSGTGPDGAVEVEPGHKEAETKETGSHDTEAPLPQRPAILFDTAALCAGAHSLRRQETKPSEEPIVGEGANPLQRQETKPMHQAAADSTAASSATSAFGHLAAAQAGNDEPRQRPLLSAASLLAQAKALKPSAGAPDPPGEDGGGAKEAAEEEVTTAVVAPERPVQPEQQDVPSSQPASLLDQIKNQHGRLRKADRAVPEKGVAGKKKRAATSQGGSSVTEDDEETAEEAAESGEGVSEAAAAGEDPGPRRKSLRTGAASQSKKKAAKDAPAPNESPPARASRARVVINSEEIKRATSKLGARANTRRSSSAASSSSSSSSSSLASAPSTEAMLKQALHKKFSRAHDSDGASGDDEDSGGGWTESEAEPTPRPKKSAKKAPASAAKKKPASTAASAQPPEPRSATMSTRSSTGSRATPMKGKTAAATAAAAATPRRASARISGTDAPRVTRSSAVKGTRK